MKDKTAVEGEGKGTITVHHESITTDTAEGTDPTKDLETIPKTQDVVPETQTEERAIETEQQSPSHLLLHLPSHDTEEAPGLSTSGEVPSPSCTSQEGSGPSHIDDKVCSLSCTAVTPLSTPIAPMAVKDGDGTA